MSQGNIPSMSQPNPGLRPPLSPCKIIGCTLMHRVPVLGDRRHHDGRGKKLADFLCRLCRMAKVSEVNSNANIIIKMFSFHQILVLVWFVAHFVKAYKEYFFVAYTTAHMDAFLVTLRKCPFWGRTKHKCVISHKPPFKSIMREAIGIRSRKLTVVTFSPRLLIPI